MGTFLDREGDQAMEIHEILEELGKKSFVSNESEVSLRIMLSEEWYIEERKEGTYKLIASGNDENALYKYLYPNAEALRELGYMLTTALRKWCNSDASFIVWNVIANDVVSSDQYDKYLGAILPYLLEDGKVTKKAMLEAIEGAHMYGPGTPILKSGLMLLTDEDWEAILRAINEDEYLSRLVKELT